MAQPSTDNAGSAYKALVELRLNEEDSRAAALQSRGLAIVTTSGALVTALLAVTGVALRPPQVAMSRDARTLLFAAAATFAAAAACGLGANLPRAYARPLLTDLTGKVSSDNWSRARIMADQEIAMSRAAQLKVAERSSDLIAIFVRCGIGLEVAAVALVGSAVWLFLL